MDTATSSRWTTMSLKFWWMRLPWPGMLAPDSREFGRLRTLLKDPLEIAD
jgi:hypothetical protein